MREAKRERRRISLAQQHDNSCSGYAAATVAGLRLPASVPVQQQRQGRKIQEINTMAHEAHRKAAEHHEHAAKAHHAAAAHHEAGDHAAAHEHSEKAHEHSEAAHEHSTEAHSHSKSKHAQ